MTEVAKKCLFSMGVLVLGQMANAEIHLMTYAHQVEVAPVVAVGQSATAFWNPSLDTNVVGYFVRYGFSSGSCTNLLDAGMATNAMVFGLEVGNTYYFSVSAYDKAGMESLPSNEVGYVVTELLSGTATNVVLQMKNNSGNGMTLEFQALSAGVYEVQATEDFYAWNTVLETNVLVGTIVIAMNDAKSYSRRFYRMVQK